MLCASVLVVLMGKEQYHVTNTYTIDSTAINHNSMIIGVLSCRINSFFTLTFSDSFHCEVLHVTLS